MADLTRREWLAGVAVGAAAAGAAAMGAGCDGPKRTGVVHKNAEFYGADGKFNDAAGKKAYFELMDAFGYPISKNVRDNMWAVDFGIGRFTEAGMGGIAWINEKEGKYFGHEIWLLPGQMIPEHWHVKTEDAVPKMEAWQLRYGGVTLFAEGDPTPGAEVLIPAAERQFTTCRRAQVLKPGELGKLEKAEAKHFMVAGPEGAIVTEYATYHDNKALRFSNPKAKL
jgi:D-lyxose ketol-isomerase